MDEPGICLCGGAEQTGTTVRIRTAGARKLGWTLLRFIDSVLGLNEHVGTAGLIVGGAGIRIDAGGFMVLIVTVAAVVDEDGLELLYCGGYWGLR